MNNFDFIAPVYDLLARLVFRGDLHKAENHFLSILSSDDSVLILGGGTGEILEFLPECQSVTFIEKSKKMVERAKLRKSTNLAEFIQKDFTHFETKRNYDVVICTFFLDCFNSESLELIVSKIKSIISPKGHLIVTDFKNDSNSVLLILMHFFFRVIASLESRELRDIHQHICRAGFNVEKEDFFHKNTVFSRVYTSAVL